MSVRGLAKVKRADVELAEYIAKEVDRMEMLTGVFGEWLGWMISRACGFRYRVLRGDKSRSARVDEGFIVFEKNGC